MKKTLKRAEELSLIDHLTGAANAYVDLDNFKTVNDRLGHGKGDDLLRIVVNTAKNRLRDTGVIARSGGDEFAILLPETGQEAARAVTTKIQRSLLSEMRNNGWPVTFSIGLLTCIEMPRTVDELIRMADDLMYSVKNNGKNAIGDSIYAGWQAASPGRAA